jgi:ketosteroid isomerase-like protein
MRSVRNEPQADPQCGKASLAFAKPYGAVTEIWPDLRAHLFGRHHRDRRPVVRLSVEDCMPIGSSSFRRVGIACCLLFASLCSREVPNSRAQSAQSQEQTTRAAINRFNEAFNRHDADAVAETLTEDTIFEDTSPVPDGRRIEGKAAVVDFWRGWFAHNADARFETEEVIVGGNHATVLWTYRKMRDGQPWHVRGVDVFTVRNGKIAAKLAYVKG